MNTVNWQKVVNEIQKQGWTQVKIAEATGVSQSVLSRLKTGEQDDVYWWTGEALLKLHDRLRPKA